MNYVSIKDKNGVEVLSWGKYSGRTSHTISEEAAFYDITTQIYLEAWREAGAEMKVNGELTN